MSTTAGLELDLVSLEQPTQSADVVSDRPVLLQVSLGFFESGDLSGTQLLFEGGPGSLAELFSPAPVGLLFQQGRKASGLVEVPPTLELALAVAQDGSQGAPTAVGLALE
jgi:hypothetical protein